MDHRNVSRYRRRAKAVPMNTDYRHSLLISLMVLTFAVVALAS